MRVWSEKTAFVPVMQNFENLGAMGRGYPFLVETPKKTCLHGNTRFGIQIVEIGQEMRPVGVMKKATKERKDATNRLFAQITHVELPPPNFSCEVGPGRNDIFQVSLKSVQGFRLHGESNLPFSYT